MSDCLHKKRARGEVTRQFRSAKFKSEGTVCSSCGTALWDAEMSSKFMKWLMGKAKKQRALFQVQPRISAKAWQCLEKLRKDFPASSDLSIVRALVILYLDVVLKDRDLTERVENLVDTPQYAALQDDGSGSRMTLSFNPLGIVAVDAWTEITGLSHARVVEEAINRMLAMYLTVDKVGKDLWSVMMRDRLGTLLLAA